MRRQDELAVWQRPKADAISWARWGEEFVAYHRPSGKTHFLNSASEYLITELLAKPMDTEAIISAFGPPDSLEDREVYSEDIGAMLEWLDQLGLIRRL